MLSPKGPNPLMSKSRFLHNPNPRFWPHHAGWKINLGSNNGVLLHPPTTSSFCDAMDGWVTCLPLNSLKFKLSSDSIISSSTLGTTIDWYMDPVCLSQIALMDSPLSLKFEKNKKINIITKKIWNIRRTYISQNLCHVDPKPEYRSGNTFGQEMGCRLGVSISANNWLGLLHIFITPCECWVGLFFSPYLFPLPSRCIIIR